MEAGVRSEKAAAASWQRLLDLDQDLVEALGKDVARRARDRLGVETLRLQRGVWDPGELDWKSRRTFAVLVCDGIIVRELDLAGTLSAELLGPGDLIALGHGRESEPLLAVGRSWLVSRPATVALLDGRLLPGLHAWPVISARLIARAAAQAGRAAEQRAISQLPRVELRIRALLWHLAERWGRMGPSGIVVPIELTHGALGRLVGAQRPTVTLALGEMSRDGSVVRRTDGAWILREDSNPSTPAGTRPRISNAALLASAADTTPGRTPFSHPVHGMLAERSQRAREMSAQQRLRSEILLERCRATRGRALGLNRDRSG
jgi:CRP/FNR family transcriptional regulator, cyclic AMP receptor protein